MYGPASLLGGWPHPDRRDGKLSTIFCRALSAGIFGRRGIVQFLKVFQLQSNSICQAIFRETKVLLEGQLKERVEPQSFLQLCEWASQSRGSFGFKLVCWKPAIEGEFTLNTDGCSKARGGFSYFITFTDDHSRYGYVYLMKYKSESFEKFKEFRNEVAKQIGKSIVTLRSDRGGEYLSDEFRVYLKDNGIVPQWTPPGTPQLNGVSERRNRY
nr:uncharacterized protein LOC113739183 [Coffea arabica]